MSQTVVGIFESSSKAQQAVQELVAAGVSRDKIDVSGSSNSDNSGMSNSSDSSFSSDSSYSSGSSLSSNVIGNDSDTHESGISKFFKSLFGNDDDDADKYTHVASRAQSIVTVHAQSGDEAERVADVLDDNGAVDVDEHASTTGYNKSGTGTGMENTSNADYSTLATDATLGLAGGMGGVGTFTGTTDADYRDDTTANETNKIPVIEENLEVGKREVTTGGVRVRSRIVERPVEESLRLREERVNVERNTVNRPATDADLKNFQERDIEMVERAEVPVVNKEARVVEEISIGKNVEERNETVKDTVRKTEVDVEDIDKSNLNDTYSSKS